MSTPYGTNLTEIRQFRLTVRNDGGTQEFKIFSCSYIVNRFGGQYM